MRAFQRFLRFVLRVQGAVFVRAEIRPGEDVVALRVRRRKNAQPRCPVCTSAMGGKIVSKHREWRHLDMLGVRTVLAADIREGRCPRCRARRVERVPWAAPGARRTHVFDRRVASLAQVADKSAATRIFRIAWPTVGRIVERVVDALLPKDRLDGLRGIAVDETSHKRGHRYITVVSCVETGRVVWVHRGKSADTLHAFFDELGETRAHKLEVVAMDMSEAYLSAVKDRAPHADIVFDRFHVVKLLLEAVDEVRRDECRALRGDERKALKNTRFPLLRNPKHLKPKDHAAIATVQATNARLFRTYQHRVDFEDLWERDNEQDARAFLMKWTRAALLSRRKPLRRFATTVRKHIDGILGYFRHDGLTSALAEGLNNKIKLIMHRAFGFSDLSALTSMIYLCCSGIDLSEA